MPPAITPAAQGSIPQPNAFKMQTRRSRRAVPDANVTSFGQFARQDMEQVGYLANIYVQVFGTITVGATPTGTNWSQFFPWNLVSNLALRSNEGLEIYRSRGYTNRVIRQLNHIGQNVSRWSAFAGLNTDQNASDGYGSGSISSEWTASVAGTKVVPANHPTLSATAIAAGTVNVMVTYKIPVAVDDNLDTGLILLQNQATRLQLELGFCQVSDLVQGTPGANPLGTSPAINLTVRTVQEFFSVPADPNSQPNTDFIHRWIEEQQPWTATGDQIYRVPVNGVILRVLEEIQDPNLTGNTGIDLPFYAAGNPNSPNLGNITVQYASSMQPEVLDSRLYTALPALNYGVPLPDGMILHDFALGGGSVELGFDGRDVYDTSLLTTFQLITNITATPGAGSRIYYCREELQKRV